jgi:2-methylaconitate cis-trans-isomerase PrpF
MRGGTSRGPYFLREHLPADRDEMARVILAAVGAPMRGRSTVSGVRRR